MGRSSTSLTHILARCSGAPTTLSRDIDISDTFAVSISHMSQSCPVTLLQGEPTDNLQVARNEHITHTATDNLQSPRNEHVDHTASTWLRASLQRGSRPIGRRRMKEHTEQDFDAPSLQLLSPRLGIEWLDETGPSRISDSPL